MKKSWVWLLWASLLPVCTACFEIREEVDIKKDGSGTYALLVDMSQSKAMLELAMAMTENKDKLPLGELDSSFVKGTARFQDVPGISQVQPINNRQDFVFGMKFDFKDVAALNLALQKSTSDPQTGRPATGPAPEVYKYAKRTLERSGDFFLKGLADLDALASDNSENTDQVKTLLKSGSYVSIIRTEGKIRKFSNPAAELSYTAKEVRFSANLLDLIENKASCANTVKFK
jgi:hypothetical protein